jgi:hypothetical protein
MNPLNADLLADWIQEAAWRSALLNLEAHSLQPMEPLPDSPGVFVGPWRDDYDAARMFLLPQLAKACPVRGAPLIFAPSVGRVWVTGSEDVEGISATLDAIEAYLAEGSVATPYQFRQVLAGWPWVARGEEVVRWVVPASHPLAKRIEALDANLAKRRSASAQHIGAFAKAVYRPGELTEQSE